MIATMSLVIYPLILLVIVALVVRGFGGRGRVRVYRPRGHGHAARIVLGVLGLATFAGVGFSTWQDIHSRYSIVPEPPSPEAAPAVTEDRPVKVPDMVLEPPPSGDGTVTTRWSRKDLAKPDVYLYLVISEEIGTVNVTRQIEPFGNIGKSFGGGWRACDFRLLGRQCETRVTPLAAWWETPHGSMTTPTLRMHASYQTRLFLNSMDERRTSWGGFDFPTVPLGRLVTQSPRSRMVSLERDLPRTFQLWVVGIAAEPGSTEKEISASEFVRTYGGDMYKQFPAHIGPIGPSYAAYDALVDMTMRGVALIHAKGVAVVALLMAALLMAEVFRRRLVALAVLAVVVVLYVAAWDRYGLTVHVSKMNDESAPLAVRMQGCENTQLTYFYKETARKSIELVKADPRAPEQLKQVAEGAWHLSWR